MRQILERAKGIEPSYAAWEAAVLPLNYARQGSWFLTLPSGSFNGAAESSVSHLRFTCPEPLTKVARQGRSCPSVEKDGYRARKVSSM
jgi:hypothetical protein